jgi:hypothetical protein
MSEQGEALFQRFVQHGFEGLVDDQPRLLAKWLRDRAAQTGRAGLIFVSEAIDAAYALFLDHDEYGGVRFGFIRKLDEAVYSRLPAIQRADIHWCRYPLADETSKGFP